MNNLKILIMPSTDGQEYASACLIPLEMTLDEADALVLQASTDENNREAREETYDWDWDKFRASLEKHGFKFLTIETGRVAWDQSGGDEAGD